MTYMISHFRGFVCQAFELAAKEFLKEPSAANWTRLQNAMWAWQQVESLDPNRSEQAGFRILELLSNDAQGNTQVIIQLPSKSYSSPNHKS